MLAHIVSNAEIPIVVRTGLSNILNSRTSKTARTRKNVLINCYQEEKKMATPFWEIQSLGVP